MRRKREDEDEGEGMEDGRMRRGEGRRGREVHLL